MPRTLHTTLEETTKALADSSPTPRLDAEVLAGHALHLSRTQLIARANHILSKSEDAALRTLIARRQRGEPVAYLTGSREFWSLNLLVAPAVLIPRPETELLVERALVRMPTDAALRVADLGTGSGAIALALARERSRAQVVAVDASAAALEVAKENAARHKITNMTFRQGDWTAALNNERFHVIVSNPPYIRDDDPHLVQGDLRFEPVQALRGGPDGLDAIRRIIAGAKDHLLPGGWLLLEHGFDQKDAVLTLMKQHGLIEARDYRDYSGNDRVAEAYRE